MSGRAVILAAGCGTRMREAVSGVTLSFEQRTVADRGLKMLMPIAGRPFLEWSLEALAAAGVDEACTVIGPHTVEVRERLESMPSPPLRLSFATQEQPAGSANAVLAAEPHVGTGPFLVINGDNLYPVADLRRLLETEGQALIGYSIDGLLAGGIPAERIRAFALLETDADGTLRRIIEKPTAVEAAALPDARVSMTCWRFDRAIFDACRAIRPSARGEYELPDAVMHEVRRGARYRVLPSEAPVADLSRREDVPRVERFVTGAAWTKR